MTLYHHSPNHNPTREHHELWEGHFDTLSPEEAERVEEREEMLADAEHLWAEELPHHQSVWEKISHNLASFYDSLVGPAMSDRDRYNRDVLEAHPGHYKHLV